MLSSITPLGERGRGNTWKLTVGAYLAGSTLGGALGGLLLGSLGELLLVVAPGDPVSIRARLVVLAAVAAAGLAADLGVAGLAVPGVRRQVDEGWIGRYRGWVYGVGYGFQLGLGVVTIVTSAVTWVALAAMVLTGSWAAGLGLGATFGLVRAVPLLSAARVHSPGALQALHVRNQRWAGTATGLAVGGEALTIVAATVLALALVP